MAERGIPGNAHRPIMTWEGTLSWMGGWLGVPLF